MLLIDVQLNQREVGTDVVLMESKPCKTLCQVKWVKSGDLVFAVEYVDQPPMKGAEVDVVTTTEDVLVVTGLQSAKNEQRLCCKKPSYGKS